MKPVIVLPPDAMSENDIDALKDNGFVVVTAKDPAVVKFLDPVPASSNRTEIEAAAVKTTQHFLAKLSGDYIQISEVKAFFLRSLLPPPNQSTPTCS